MKPETASILGHPLSSIRIGSDAERRALVSNGLVNRTFVANPDQLARAIVAGDSSWPELDAAVLDGVRAWLDHGWEESLRFYLQARDISYRDRYDSDGAVRAEILHQMLEGSDRPTRRMPAGERTSLALVASRVDESVGSVLMRRRSLRGFPAESLAYDRFSAILRDGFESVRHAQQIADAAENITDILVSYCVGLSPYVVVYAVDEIDPGAYCLDLGRSELITVRRGVFREQMQALLYGLRAPLTAAFTVVLVADLKASQWRYRHERAFRNLLMDFGRAANDVILVATAHSVSGVPTPAMRDSDLDEFLRLDQPRETAIYSVTLGADRRRRSKTAGRRACP